MAFLTVAGEEKIAYQQGNSLLFDVTHFVLANITGLGAEPVDRIEAMPAPGDIVDTKPVSRSGYVNANQVVYSLTLDSTIGDYTFNWVGLKDADGVLVAVVHLADPITKTATAGGIEGNNLVRNFLLQYTGLTATTAISAPAETWQIDFTTRLLQIDERERLSNFDIYGQFAAFGDWFEVSLVSGSDYEIAAGVCYVGGIRCEQAAAAPITVTGLPKSIWIDASLQGDLTGVSAVFSFTDTAAILTDYTDGLGFDHYVAKIADISAGGVVTDLRKLFVDDAGLIEFFHRETAPSGRLKANGATVTVAIYLKLANAIYCGDAKNPTALAGYRCDNSDGTGRNIAGVYIKLPNLRSEFLRGWDDGRGVDSGRIFGSQQIDEVISHRHKQATPPGVVGGTSYYFGNNTFNSYDYGDPGGAIYVDSFGGNETRPRNIALLACIKY